MKPDSRSPAKAPVSSAARGVLQDLDPEIPASFKTFQQVYSASLGSRRFNLILIGFFGITALLLATAGVFGVMAYSVSRRTREFGVRIALGARAQDVLVMVVGRAVVLIAAGVTLGLAGAIAFSRVLEANLFQVSATDPLTYVAVCLFLLAVAAVACVVPAGRAAILSPVTALRHD